jgi:ribosomal protein S19E (S16A)
MEDGETWSEVMIDLILENRPSTGKRSRKKDDNDVKYYMIIDEFGDQGDRKESSDALGFGITITDRKREMEIIAQDIRGEKDEHKSRDATDDEKDWTITRVARLKPETYGVYIDKRRKDLPELWKGTDRSAAFRRVMKVAVKYVLEQTEKENLLIVVDYNTSLKGKGRETIDKAVKEVAEETEKPAKKIIDYEEVNSSECDMMQAHDYVVGALRDHVYDVDGKWAKQLSMKVKKLVKR